MRILWIHSGKLFVLERCPYGEVRLLKTTSDSVKQDRFLNTFLDFISQLIQTVLTKSAADSRASLSILTIL